MQTKTPNMQIAIKIIDGDLPRKRAKDFVSFCKTQEDKEIVKSVAKGQTHPEFLTQLFTQK